MTALDKPRFLQAFNRLAVAVRLPADHTDGAMHRVYFEGLSDFGIEAIEAAAHELERQAKWFPKVSEWRDVAERARNIRALAAVSTDQRVWHAECDACDDTGWEILTCSGRVQCGREKEHAAHDYAVPCPCRPTNRTYQRRLAEQRERARGRKSAAER